MNKRNLPMKLNNNNRNKNYFNNKIFKKSRV